jgi:hypothetical protein
MRVIRSIVSLAFERTQFGNGRRRLVSLAKLPLPSIYADFVLRTATPVPFGTGGWTPVHRLNGPMLSFTFPASAPAVSLNDFGAG